MSTEKYRRRFGCLEFACAVGSSLAFPVSVELDSGAVIDGMLDNSPDRATVHSPEGFEFRLPQEVLDAGTAHVTAAVHPCAADGWVWWNEEFADDPKDISWPEETGGAATAARIVELSREDMTGAWDPSKEGYRPRVELLQELGALLKPERQRFRQQMVCAIESVVGMIYGRDSQPS